MSNRLYKLVALMPMRHNSERIPGKNYRPFGDGRLLFQHALDVLLACPKIEKVVIDTDSPNIESICKEKYPQVYMINRPEHLRDGSVPMNDVLLHDLSQVESEFYLQTHSTNPLLTVETLRQAIDMFFENYPFYDSLFSVTKVQTRFWDSLARPINHNANILLRTQDLPPYFEENSCIYIFPRDVLRGRRNRIGHRPLLFEMDPFEAQDIDQEINFQVAEAIFRAQQNKGAAR